MTLTTSEGMHCFGEEDGFNNMHVESKGEKMDKWQTEEPLHKSILAYGYLLSANKSTSFEIFTVLWLRIIIKIHVYDFTLTRKINNIWYTWFLSFSHDDWMSSSDQVFFL